MNSMIPNPTRTITLTKSVDYVMKRLKYIGGWAGENAGIRIVQANIDYNLNTYTFKSKANITAFGDFGNFGNVSLTPTGENQCSLTIEIGKNVGSISDQFEAQDCMAQINAFLNVLSSIINKSEEEVANYPKKEDGEDSSPVSISWGLIIGAIALVIIFALL